MIYSWQTVNQGNLAEQICRPTDYFNLGHPVTVIPNNCKPVDFTYGPVIFGASGLLYPEISPILESAVMSKQYPMVAWGIGHNTHGGTEISYPDWLRRFDLVGLRDYHSPYPYVPCPSCMHSAFDVDYTPTRDLVIYDQIDFPVGVTAPGVPRENNFHPPQNMKRIVEFLGSARTILTSSYHGTYWGYLLNRQVLIWKPWSTKFSTLKPNPCFVDEETWNKPHPAQNHYGYLQECRHLNRVFAERVKSKLR